MTYLIIGILAWAVWFIWAVVKDEGDVACTCPRAMGVRVANPECPLHGNW